MEANKTQIVKPEGYHCFGCGTANPVGLNLNFYKEGESICSDLVLSRNYAGWENIVHGGIISTLIDELMAWSVIYFKRQFFFTRKMEVTYIRPVLAEVPVTVKGTITDDSSLKRLKAAAEIFDGDGTLLARGSGEFILMKKEELDSVSEEMKEEMFSFLEKVNPVNE